MSRIWTEAGFVADDAWVIETEGVTTEPGARIILPFNDFLQMTENTPESDDSLAVLVEPADAVSKLAPHLSRLALIAVSFPAFNDGRAFSHASLLRSRHGFAGEIRAVGDVLIDQIPLMLRCGIDSFAVSNETALKRLEEGRLTGIPLHYQPAARPAADIASADTASYVWRRRSSPAA